MKATSFTLLVSLEFGVVLMCLFSIAYLATIDWKKNRWLILAFVVFSGPVINGLLSSARYDVLPYNSWILNPAPLLLLFPALYFYTFDLVKPNTSTHLTRSVHTIPFFVFYIINGIIGFELPINMMKDETKCYFLIAFMIATISVSLFYGYQILRLVWLNQNKYQNQYAETNIFLTLDWLKWMIYILIGMPIIGGIGNYMMLKNGIELSTFPSTITMLFTCCTLAYFSFRQKTLYSQRLPIPKKSESKSVQEKAVGKTSISSKATKTENSSSNISISKDEKSVYIAQIETYMTEEQPFLNPKIRMPELAKSLKISRHVFSYLINEHYNMNFFYFINQYRIEYAKALLLDKENDFYTLETISQMAGFNSKSTFNTRFKELVGKSPTAFKKEGK